jgi:hypothetical protein
LSDRHRLDGASGVKTWQDSYVDPRRVPLALRKLRCRLCGRDTMKALSTMTTFATWEGCWIVPPMFPVVLKTECKRRSGYRPYQLSLVVRNPVVLNIRMSEFLVKLSCGQGSSVSKSRLVTTYLFESENAVCFKTKMLLSGCILKR